MNIINRYTLQTLKKNKMRTLVTIVGIILSTAMFTGVTSIISSFQKFELDMEINESGKWEGRLNQLSAEEVQKLLDGGDVKESTTVGYVGYSRLKDSLNEDKPYLCVVSTEKEFEEMGAFHLREGRMPKNKEEIVLPVHLEENGGVSYQIGDTLTLELGNRTVDAKPASQTLQYMGEDAEKLENCRTKQYTVVGFCERSTYEDFSAPGYTAFTTGEKDMFFEDVLFTSNNTKEIEKQIQDFLTKTLGRKKSEIEIDKDYGIHVGLLRITGEYQGQTYQNVLFSMAAFLILIIMVASVTLIYNAFSISLSERTKQFGLLKSIGATKKQIRHGVYFEALSLCLIGIPLGVGSGLIGIAITLHFVGDLMKDFINVSGDLTLHLYVYPLAIVVAVVVAVITVLISAMIPARRAVKMTAIDALRESQDIKIRSKRIRSSKLVYLLFGFEGMLANKNFKRNRKKYRLTVFSIVISIILFVGSSTFNLAMNTSLDMYANEETADIALSILDDDMNGVDEESARNKLGALQYVDSVAYSKSVVNAYVVLDKDDVNQEYYELNMDGKKAMEEAGEEEDIVINPYFLAKNTGDKVLVPVKLNFVDDASYEEYLRENHLDVSKYMDSKNLHPVIWDEIMMYTENKTIASYHVLGDDAQPREIYCINQVKGYEYYEDPAAVNIKTMEFPFAKKGEIDESDDEVETTLLPAKKALTKVTLDGGVTVDYKAPLGINSIDRWFGSMTMTLPYSAKSTLSNAIEMTEDTSFMFAAEEYRKANTAISNFLQGDATFGKNSVSNVYSIRESEEASRALMLVIGVFTYGFIILISLIVIANVFNTISTNVLLRRKEFAMLKSVGMTRKGSNRMMNFECLLYGVKGLIIGLPISLLLSHLLCKSLSGSIELGVLIPWASIVIVIIGVFVVVFASMLYSMQKIKKDNPIDALKNDVI